MGVALTELGLVPLDVTRAEVELARELDVMVTAHIGTVTSDRRAPEVELLHDAGLLDHRQVHVHCNACSNRELDLLADAGASVSLTPETELQMGMGFPIFARAMERGLRPTLGCDIVSNNSGDLFAQMRLGLQAERARANQAALDGHEMPEELTLGVRDVLRFATLGGAEALGLDSCHRIDRARQGGRPRRAAHRPAPPHAGQRPGRDGSAAGGSGRRRRGARGRRGREAERRAARWAGGRGAGAGPRLARADRGGARAARRPAAARSRGLVRGHDAGDGAEPGQLGVDVAT